MCTIGSDSTSISLLNNRMLILRAISGIITEIHSATMEGGTILAVYTQARSDYRERSACSCHCMYNAAWSRSVHTSDWEYNDNETRRVQSGTVTLCGP